MILVLVTTLPIKPRANSVAGYYFPFVVADIITRNLKGEFFACLNSVAIDGHDDLPNLMKEMLNDLDRIDSKPSFIMMDHIEPFRRFVIRRVFEMIAHDRIISKQTMVYSCECGLVETLDLKQGYEGTLIAFSDGKPYCKSCRLVIKPVSRRVLIEQGVKTLPDLRLIPDSYYSKLSTPRQRLVSRSRQTHFSVPGQSQKFFLDTDFACRLYLDYLTYLYGFSNVLVVVANPSLNYLAQAASHLGDHVDLTAIGLPYLFANGKERMQDHPEYRLDSLISELGPLGFRLFLLQGMSLSRDHAIVEIERLNSVVKAERRIKAQQIREMNHRLEELIDFLELNNLRDYLANPQTHQPVPLGLGGLV